MDIFNASAMGMLFSCVNVDGLLGGNSEKLSHAQEDIAGRLGLAAASAGGLSPSLQEMANEMAARFPQAVQYMLNAGNFGLQHRDKLANIPQYLRQFSQGGVHMLSAGQIAAGTTSAFITMCHVVSNYDNALKLAEANIKLDELLKVHSREYKADLESVYNRLGELFLESAAGQDRHVQFQDCSQGLDRLVLIWLDETINELEPVKESLKGLDALTTTKNSLKKTAKYSPAAALLPVVGILGVAYTVLYSGPVTLAGHQVYSSCIKDISIRLNKVDGLVRCMGIAIWLRHVISHHTASMQPLYNKYSARLEKISSKASRIKEALEQSQKFISVDSHVMTQLQKVAQLPQHVQVMLAAPQERLMDWQDDARGIRYRVMLNHGTFVLENVN